MSFRFVDVDEDFQTLLPNLVSLYGDDPTFVASGLQGQTGIEGRGEEGPFGSTAVVGPNFAIEPLGQRPRQATQLVLDNAIVLRIGTWPLAGEQAVVVTAAPPPTPEGGAAAQDTSEQAPPPTATPIPVPDVITLILTRQDALVLKYALETGADIDLALRSPLDDDINDIVTDTVTLQYILDFYNVDIPPRLPIAQDPRIDEFFVVPTLPIQLTPVP